MRFPHTVPEHLPRWQFWSVVLLAVLSRGILVAWQIEDLDLDVDAYRHYAETLAETGIYGVPTEGEIYPSAYRAPVYPGLLAGLMRIGEPFEKAIGRRVLIGGLHVVLGGWTIAVVLWLGRQGHLGRGAVAAGLLVAFDPILLHQSTLVMSETLATCLIVLALALCTRAGRMESVDNGPENTDTSSSPASRFLRAGGRRSARILCESSPGNAAMAGGMTAVAALCRPSLFVFLVACPLAFLVLPDARHRRWRKSVAYLFAALVVLAPWTFRNVSVFGRPIVATTHGGYTLHLANNPSFYAYVRTAPWGTIWKGSESILPCPSTGAGPDPPGQAGPAGEWARDRYHYAEAWAAIGADPAGFGRSALVRLGRFWQLVPHPIDPDEQPIVRGLRYAVGVWYVFVSIGAVVGVWRLGRALLMGPWIWGLLLCLSLSAVHTIYWSNMRMRAMAVPVVALAAGAAIRSPWDNTRKSFVEKDMGLSKGP